MYERMADLYVDGARERTPTNRFRNGTALKVGNVCYKLGTCANEGLYRTVQPLYSLIYDE